MDVCHFHKYFMWLHFAIYNLCQNLLSFTGANYLSSHGF